jgi:hypothetical protein
MLEQIVDLPANSRVAVPVGADQDYGGFGPSLANARFGVLVESLASTTGGHPPHIVVERAMYSSAMGSAWSAGTNALATPLR